MNPNPTKGWILYDDSCGFCRRGIPFWEGALRRRGFAVSPLQADWVRIKTGLHPEELLQDLQLLQADGAIIRGADVYRYATRHIWWAWPIYLFSVAPGLRNIFDWGYRTFAAHRYQVSQACHLPAPTDQD
jgi:predicted DCC family thiol-disulfide oxidoreductase YuxK